MTIDLIITTYILIAVAVSKLENRTCVSGLT